MADVVESILNAPVSSLLIVAGLIFLGIAAVGSITGKIEPGKKGRIAAGVIGAILLVTGIAMYEQNVHPNGDEDGTPTPPLPPVLSVSSDPFSFNFGAMSAGESSSKIFSISNTGSGILTWSVSDDQPWITVNPTSGTNSGTVTININTAGLSPGSYTGTITITSNDRTKTGTISLTIPSTSSIPAPQLILSGTESYTAGGKQWVRYSLAVTNWAEFPAELFESAPDLPPCGLNKNASRTWVNIYNAKDDSYIYGFCALSSPQDLNSVWFAVAQGTSPPAGVYIILTDRRKSITYRSNVVSPQQP